MIRHVVAFRWTPEATDPQIAAATEALRALPSRIPEIRSYEVGADLGWRDDGFDLAVVALFDDQAGWRTYVDHPAHQAVVTDHIGPIRADRASVQFEI